MSRLALPAGPLAAAPAEARGIPRDGVRMLVATPDGIGHRRAADLPDVLVPGDLVVINDSRTLPASLAGVTATGEPVEVHLSTLLPAAGRTYPEALGATRSEWRVEVRRPGPNGSQPSYVDRSGLVVSLAGGGTLRVHGSRTSRLWEATIGTPRPLERHLAAFGEPIRYGYVDRPWPVSAYRTVYGNVSGSAEMPSAGRPLTWRLLRRLADRGVQVERLTLHCGVSSLESNEPPYAEWFSVPERTAAAVAAARGTGRRVIAVGTTVVRALESAAGRAASGWTDLVVTAERGVSTVDGLLSGWHEPEASHLDLLQAVAGAGLLRASYAAAAEHGYLWHEFGDVHLMLR